MSRSTIQRKLVLDAVNSLGSHPSPEEVYAFITPNHPTVSKGTVYRNLGILAQEGHLLKIETPEGADRFDHKCHKHYHFQCEKCLRVFDVDMDYMPDIYNKIKDKQGFEYTDHNIIFTGSCPNCKTS